MCDYICLQNYTLKVSGISVVIPNYNGRLLLEQIIPPLIQSLIHINIPYEIIVADDASVDVSVSFLQGAYKEITVLKNGINSGFSITANKGIFAAKLSHVLLLNSDVKLTKDYFIPLLRYFDKPDTFGVMGRITGWDDDEIQDGGKYPYFHGAKIKTSGNYIPAHPIAGNWLYSMYLSGANALIDKDKLYELRGFDEIFSPYYIEDFELSLRAWRLGWKCYYEHFAVCRHKTSVTIKSFSSKKKIAVIYNRNKMFLHAIHLSGADKIFWYAQLMLEILLHIITLRWSYLKSVNLFYKKRSAACQSRRAFRAILIKHNTKKTVKQVADLVRNELAEIPLKRF